MTNLDNQSILKEINPGISLEGRMLKLKLQYSGLLMRRVDSLENNLMLGGIGAGGKGDDRGWDGWVASLTRWTRFWVNSGIWLWTGRPGVLQFMGSQRVGHDWVTELNWMLNNDKDLYITKKSFKMQICLHYSHLHHQLPWTSGESPNALAWLSSSFVP